MLLDIRNMACYIVIVSSALWNRFHNMELQKIYDYRTEGTLPGQMRPPFGPEAIMPDPAGSTGAVYPEGDFGSFAVHLLRN